MSEYLELKLLAANPFETLDQEGVGQLVRMAVERGRATRPDIKLGICGEHGGDPASVAVLRRGRPRLRVVLALPRADRPPRRRARRARRRRPGHPRRSVSVTPRDFIGAVTSAPRTSPHTETAAPAVDDTRTRARTPSWVGASCPARSGRRSSTLLLAPGRHPSRRRGESAPGPRSPTRTGCASSATSTGSSTRARGGAWRASARCSSPPKTTISAPGSPTRSRSPRSPPGIARAANLCLPLVEAIALAHDCGHGPAGHASEEAFSPYLPGTGYDHAVYGADVTLARAQPVRRDARRRAQPLLAPPAAVHARGRGGGVGRPHRVRLPRLRGRGAGRHPRARRPPGRGPRRRRGRAIGAGRHVRARGARRHRPHRRRRHDRAGRVGARRSSGRSTSSGSTSGPRRDGRPSA